MYFNQNNHNIKLEWGIQGIQKLAPDSDVMIIIDVLSFSTAVDIATSNGALIFPYRYKDESAQHYADSLGAALADKKRKAKDGLSLSPSSLTSIPTHTKLVLPSPNGSTLSLSSGNTPTICGCIRNAQAVAEQAMSIGDKIAIIPAGEKWEDGSLRFAIEDFLGAGAILSFLTGGFSPESEMALAAFNAVKENLRATIKACGSGKELIGRGFENDVDLACALNVSPNVPVLQGNYYVGNKI